MLSLTLGLCAALTWGVHDICVRYISQNGGIMPALTMVLIAGSLVLTPVALMVGGWSDMTGSAYGYAFLSGFFYIFGGIGLYKSLGIGPVRLVAPIVAAYPILSVSFAALRGQFVSVDQWLAIGTVVLGVAVVSMLSDNEDSPGGRAAAIAWAVLAAVGFALTFAVGHLATQVGAELPVVLLTRVVTACLAAIILIMRKGPKLPDRKAWPLLVLMGALDALALGLVFAAGGLERPEFAAVAASTFGIITILLAWAFLKERMTLAQWAGVGVTFAGIGYLAA